MRIGFPIILLAAALAAGTGALAQTTGAIPPSAPGGTRQWSGEDGASGHPLMSAAAIRQSAANFRQCVAEMWPLAARRGISRTTFDSATASLTPDLRIMDLMDSQPEFTKSFWDYLDVLISDARIQKGRELLQAHRSTLDAIEKAYGVDKHILVAIWGVETNYGAISGERPILRSTATLACIGRRQDYFKEEFLTTLEILHHKHVRADHLVGSWAGAFGGTQFMPRTFKRFAVDYDGDGRRDTVDSLGDMAASTANMMKKNGWRSGESWGYEVVLPATLNFHLADRGTTMSIREWEKHGIHRPDRKPFPRGDDQAFLLVPAGVQGPGFLMLHNFRVIMRYNPAEAYALAIGHLADRLRGGEPFKQEWPRYERTLSRSERLELQGLLAKRGYSLGEPDGNLGGKTRAAIRDFQAKVGQVPDGFASGTVLDRLRR